MSITMQECRTDEVADELMELIRPYYKGLRRHGDKPDFRKCLKSDEVEDILLTLHDLVVKLKTDGAEH